jgi:hypothetical protein
MSQKVILAWYDFWSEIKLLRKTSSDKVVYVGTWDDHGRIYEEDFEMTRKFFDNNQDEIDFIDNFAKTEIAKKIYLTQVNKQRNK